jgi:hypothetical protein
MSIFNAFVQNPAWIALIGGLFFVAYLFLRGNPQRRSRALLVPATAWLLWAVWEWAITVFSPEANIRVDLLLIIPVVLIASGFGIAALFFKRTPSPTE